MFNGVPGTKTERLYFNFINAAANKVRDCKVWSSYDQFMNKSLVFTNLKNRKQRYVISMNEYHNRVVVEYKYEHFMFDFDSAYKDRNLFFVFGKEKDEYIGSDETYHWVANDRFLRFKKPVPSVNNFLRDVYMNWHPNK